MLPLLGGCSASEEKTSEEKTISVGMSVKDVYATSAKTLAVYDLSEPILGVPASFGTAGVDDGNFVVVAVCPEQREKNAEWWPIAVVPSGRFTPEVEERARRGEFRSYLVECAEGTVEGRSQ